MSEFKIEIMSDLCDFKQEKSNKMSVDRMTSHFKVASIIFRFTFLLNRV